MAWFRDVFVLSSSSGVKRPSRQFVAPLATLIERLRLRGLGLSAWRAARDAVEGEIPCRQFLRGRLARYLAKVANPPRYPLPSFSITADCELATAHPADRRHPVDFLFFTPGDVPPATGNDPLAAEARAVHAAARIRVERLMERHATVEESRARNQLRRREQEDVIEAAAEQHRQAVKSEVAVCISTAELNGLSIAIAVGWLVRSFMILAESFFLAMPVADVFGVDTSSMGAILTAPLLSVTIGITAVVLTHSAITALADSMASIAAYRKAHTFRERRLSNLLAPGCLIALLLVVLSWISGLRATYASAAGGAPEHAIGWSAVTALLLIVAASLTLRLRALQKKRGALARERAAAQALTALSARLICEAQAEDARLREEGTRTENDIDTIRAELEHLHQELRRLVHCDIEHGRAVVRVLEDLLFRDQVQFTMIARRFGYVQLLPDVTTQRLIQLERR